MKYLTDNKILYRNPLRFHMKYTTDTCLFYLTNKILRGPIIDIGKMSAFLGTISFKKGILLASSPKCLIISNENLLLQNLRH